MVGEQGSSPGARHLSFESIDTYWAADVPVEIPVPGEPSCRLRLDPRHDEISLVTPLAGAEPDVSRMRNFKVTLFRQDEATWAELRIVAAQSLHAAYGLLASIADRVQLRRERLAVAVSRAIAEHRGLLAGRPGMAEEQEIGLYGELLVLESLLRDGDPDRAVGAWIGPLHEEHDFAFEDARVEVKTTSTEHRIHLITGLRQLEPVEGIPLWLLSIQITRAGNGQGRTLAALIQDVRAVSGDRITELERLMAAAGWDDDLASVLSTVWTPRNAPLCYRVDESFPALTEQRLIQTVPQPAYLSDITYRVDVTHLAAIEPPDPIKPFVLEVDTGR